MAGFGKSFSDAYEKSSTVASAGTLDAIKEKIKLDQTKADETKKVSNYLAMTAELGKTADPATQDRLAKLIGDSTKTWDAESAKSLYEFAESGLKEKIKANIEQEAQLDTYRKLGIKIPGGTEQPQPQTSTTTGEQESTESPLSQIQKQLPEDVSLKIGDITVTGSKVDVSQKKLINEIAATESGINRIVGMADSVPDIGGIDFKSARGIGKALSLLPRGLEGRARELSSKYFTAGGGEGLTGLSKQDETNLRTYISNLPTSGGDAYKTLSGDSGRLSDFDLQRGMNLLWRPDLGETTEIREKKGVVLKEAVKERAEAIKQGKFEIDPETGAILTPQVFDNALQKLSGGKQNVVLMQDDTGAKALVDTVSGKVIKEL